MKTSEHILKYIPSTPFLKDCWAGNVSLAKAFWLVYFSSRFSAVILFMLILVYGGTYTDILLGIYTFTTVLVFAWGWHVLWRNAKNTKHVFLKYLCRAVVIIEFCYLLWLAY